MTPPAADISLEESLTNSIRYSANDSKTIADYPMNYTKVDWDLGTVTDEYNHTWTSDHYQFGPTINWHTRYTNGSLLVWDDGIAVDQYVDFRLEIPYSALTGTTPMGLYIMGSYFNMSALAESEGEFHDSGPRPIMWMVWYNITDSRWLTYSGTNASMIDGPPEELPPDFTLATVFGPEVNPFLEFDQNASGYISAAESYRATIRVRFNSTVIGGFYQISCGVQGPNFEELAQSRFEEFKSGRIIGTTFDFLVDQAVGGYYDWTRVSDDGTILHSATRGVDFNMTATITNGTELANATVLFEIPNNIVTNQLVWGPYKETQTIQGVWEYDDVADIYFWNGTKTVNWTVQKEGYHYEEGYTWIDTGREFMFWDGGWLRPETTWGRYAIIFDFATNTFSEKLAYDYRNMTWIEDEWGSYWREIYWTEYEDWPIDGRYPVPYILNEAESGLSEFNGKFVITFRGHIGPDVQPTNSEEGRPLHINDEIVDIYGRRLAQLAFLPTSSPEDSAQYELLRSLAVESPVSIVTLTHGGEPYQPDWMFQTDVAEPFTVTSWLQGGADYIQDIDGIGFFMHAWTDSWGFDGMYDWNQWTEVQIQIRIDPHGVVDVDVYNRTVRTQWSYGEHWDWIMVEVMPGRWEPQWTLIEDWFWEELTWDFIVNDWTSQWLSFESPNCRMPVHWLDVINIQQQLIGNDLRVAFDIVPMPELPQLEWQWKYYYGELTWVTDYESGWGEHTVLGWNQNTVYSYLNNTKKLYMEEPVQAEVFRNSQTGDIYQREKVPFVEINGEIINLKPYLVTNMEDSWTENVRTEFDYDTGEEESFIRFDNGTEINVYTGSVGVVYNISLPVLSTWFLSWSQWTTYTGTYDYHSMMAINGTFIVGEWGPFWSGYTATVYELVPVETVPHTYMTIANGTIPIYMVGWPEYIGNDHLGNEHYVMYLNGTYEPIEFLRNSMLGDHYWNRTDGKLYLIEWPWELLTGIYQSKQFFIPHYMADSHVYTIIGGTKYQLPAPGIPMWNVWELNNLENIYDYANSRYFATEYANVDGNWYEAVYLYQEYDPTPGYWYDVYQLETLLYNVTDWTLNPEYEFSYDYVSMMDIPWTTIANGTYFVTDMMQSDWTVAYGHRNPLTFEFVPDGWLDLQTGFYDGDYYSSRIFDDDLGFPYVTTMLGEQYFYNSSWRATFMNITLANGTSFYSRMDNPIAEPADIFDWQIDRYYMIDIYGNHQGWQGWMDYTAELIFVNATKGGPWDGQFFWEGQWVNVTQFPVDYWEWGWDEYYMIDMWHINTYMDDNVVPHGYTFLQHILNGSILEIIDLANTPESYKFNYPSWQFNTTVGTYHAYGRNDIIYEAFKVYGFTKKLDYAPLPVTIIRNQDRIVYGTPPYGMWENDVWTIDPMSGALDLDGDLGTTNDQFYVREIHQGTDYFNVTQQYLDVSILWEPDSELWDDEFHLHSFTGMVTFNWTFDWSDINIWTHTDGSSLTPTEYATVYDTIFDSYGNPRPGYWGISWMFENRTLTDMIQQAEDEGWDWMADNTQEWSWLWWELQESYTTEVSNGTHSDLMDVNLAYQYAGMFAWNDTDSDNFMTISTESLGSAELTHYWMPVDVESVSFITPGEAWGNPNTTDSEYRAVDETIDFGVSFANVTGVVYPFGERSYFDWYDGVLTGSDFTDFDERPSECLTEEFSIDVHFTGEINATGGSNSANVKFDIGVGEWDVDFPSATNPLEGMSLAVAFYSDLTIYTSGGLTANATYINDEGQVITNDQEEASLNFTMASGLSSVAMMGLGGAPYDWAFNSSYPSTVGAQTVPVSTFSEIYTSGGGSSATTFSITSQQFYTVLSFKWWDGYGVYVDPVFVSYISHGTADVNGPSLSSISHEPFSPTSLNPVTVTVNIQDPSGVDYAVLQYKIDSGDWNNVSMSSDGDIYSADIPAQAEGTVVTYRIVAVDTLGNEVVSDDFSYTIGDGSTTTIPETTTTSTSGGSGPLDSQTMMMLLAVVGGIILIVVIIAATRRRN